MAQTVARHEEPRGRGIATSAGDPAGSDRQWTDECHERERRARCGRSGARETDEDDGGAAGPDHLVLGDDLGQFGRRVQDVLDPLDVVHGLRRLRSAEAEVADQDAFHPSTLTRWQNDLLQAFGIDLEVGEESFRYRLEVVLPTADGSPA